MKKTTSKIICLTLLSLTMFSATLDAKALTKQGVSNRQSLSIARKIDKVSIIKSPIIEHGHTPWLFIFAVSGVSSLSALGIWNLTSYLAKSYISSNKNNEHNYEFVKIDDHDDNQSN